MPSADTCCLGPVLRSVMSCCSTFSQHRSEYVPFCIFRDRIISLFLAEYVVERFGQSIGHTLMSSISIVLMYGTLLAEFTCLQRWRTALILRELEDEISALAIGRPHRDKLKELVNKKEVIADLFNHLRLEKATDSIQSR